jgi:enamine deaminase RidA (YjgF/YER057c/UK114 family)
MVPQFLNPHGLCPTFGWTHVTASGPGVLVHVSGQVSVDERGQVVGVGDFAAQAEQAFKNVGIALAAAGAKFTDVVMSRIFVVGLKPELMPTFREIRSRYFSKEHPPASTLVGVQALVGPEWLIEIEVTAVIGG